MMERHSHIVSAVLGLMMLGICSCSQDKPLDIPSGPDPDDEVYDEFTVTPLSIVFEADGNPVTLTINTRYDWTIDVPAGASWCTVEPLSGTAGITDVTLTPAPYTDRTPRGKQLLTINYNSTFAMVAVSQLMPNTAPSAPVLLTPEDGAMDVKTNGTFTWKASSDPDGDSVYYKVMFSADNGQTWKTYDTESTVFKVTDLLEKETDYIWKVTVSDSFGGSAESGQRRFRTGDGGAYADGEVSRYRTESAGAPSPVHLIIMGDGYIQDDYAEGGAFDRDVENAVNALFSVEPFLTYQNWFRVSTVAVYSQERGATVLKDMTGCPSQTKNTAFSSVLEGAGTTAVSCDMEKVFSYARKVPGVSDDQLKNTTVLLLVNLNVYAGTCMMERTGRSVSICPVGPSFTNIVVHEGGGHGFGRLVDEYRYTDADLPSTSKDAVLEWRTVDPYYAYNVSFTNDKSQAHWGSYIGRTGYDAVGFFEGGLLYTRGVWRPERISCMEDNRFYYNAPSREAIVRRIYRASGSSFSMDAFYASDKVKSDNTTKASFILDEQPLAPPILIDK
ncbi:MAG: M64 family metallopeptidase [Candidatus Cryptobacteroides sp.]